MVVYRLNGIDVYFPFDAYPSQLEYMHLFLDCLQRRQNGLLESPTGTGKTLSILCATLSYLTQTEKSHRTKFYYASRTHSQLSQVSRHLKSLLRSTFKNLRMCILGSRDQMCINSTVCQKPVGYARVVACRTLNKHGACTFYHRSSGQSSRKKESHLFQYVPEAIDIEDLVKLGKEHKFCPYYFATSDLCPQADIILLPYNYLLDERIRRIHNIDVANSIIALDEAHNIEDVCEEACSSEIRLIDIEHTLQAPNEKLMTDLNAAIDVDILISINDMIKSCLNALLVNLKNLTVGKVLPGIILVDHFSKCEINPGLLDKMEQWNPKDDKLSAILHKVVCFITVVLSSRSQSGSSFCCIYDGEVVKYFCLSASLAMQRLNTAQSIILTSGTLGCFSSLVECLGLTFHVQQKFDHIIEQNRLLVLPVSKGPDGNELKFSYNERSKESTLMSLGRTVLNLSRIVPHGFLVFFTSYRVLDLARSQWSLVLQVSMGSRKSLWQCISESKKIYVESRNINEFEQVISDFRKSAEEVKGAILFAVTRGRASEGLDFTGNCARTLMMVGLPYAPRFDTKLQAKMQLLDKQKATNKAQISGNLWYEHQMYKAIGQAIGRLIRSKNDFGVLILLDSRFSFCSIQESLPSWVKRSIKGSENFGNVMRMVKEFFQSSSNWQQSFPVEKSLINIETNVNDLSPDEVKLQDDDNKATNVINFCDSNQSRKRSLEVNDAYDSQSLFRRPVTVDTQHGASLSSFLSDTSSSKQQCIPGPSKVSCDKKQASFDEMVEKRRYQMKARKTSVLLLSRLKSILSNNQLADFTKVLNSYHCSDSCKYETFRNFLDKTLTIFGQNTDKNILMMLKPFICSDFRKEFENYIESHFVHN
ncbi:hypothetical protein GJ496_003968 [Pomphorhynchus laevis]|nr:hypothetical protein GJ496_003968 [Pomphorhynchus laevis]